MRSIKGSKSLLNRLIAEYNEIYHRKGYHVEHGPSPIKSIQTVFSEQVPDVQKVLDILSSGEIYTQDGMLDLLYDIVVLYNMKHTHNYSLLHQNLLSDISNKYIAHLTIASNKVKDTVANDEGVKEVFNILNSVENSTSFLVGGFVRDSVLGCTPKDADFVTNICYDDLTSLFVKHGYTTKTTGTHFLVLFVEKHGVQYEIANFRKDGTYTSGRRPESVSIGTITDDSQRRDFSVNALYYDILNNELLDPTGLGLYDIQDNRLRFIGDPKHRLKEDKIRAYRFYRFCVDGFIPDKQSLQAVRTCIIEENIKIKSLQKVIHLPGVKEQIDIAYISKKVEIDFDILSETAVSLERMRLEIEKMVKE